MNGPEDKNGEQQAKGGTQPAIDSSLAVKSKRRRTTVLKIEDAAAPVEPGVHRRTTRSEVVPFNPLDKRVLGAAIAEAMMTTRVYPMTTSVPFVGPGLYAIYYTGDYPLYGEIASRNADGQFNTPIYVGQALPKGARKGESVVSSSAALRNRLNKHRLSLAATGLGVENFSYRVLVIDDTFIRLGEMSLIAIYTPVWNTVVDGFGNNAQGKGRKGTIRSRWDTLHPGREQALKHEDRLETKEQIEEEVRGYLARAVYQTERKFVVAEGQTADPTKHQIDVEGAANIDEAATSGVDEDDAEEQ